MRKKSVWFTMAIVLAVLCAAMIAVFVLLFVKGSAYYSEAGTDEVVSADDAGTSSATISYDASESETAYETATLEGFEAAAGDSFSEGSLSDQAGQTLADENAGQDYIIPDSGTRQLTDADLEGLTAQELTYARNEIYARHGRAFNSTELQQYFDSKGWYLRDDSFKDSELSKLESTNAEFISEYQQDHNLNYKAN